MHKILKGAKEAVIAAKCDHNLTALPPTETIAKSMFDSFYCNKCKITLHIPKTKSTTPIP
jgi:hypothetical protein